MAQKIERDLKVSDGVGPPSDLNPLLEEPEDLNKEYRIRKSNFVTKSVPTEDVEGELNRGWELVREGKRSSRLRKVKSADRKLEDRVWCLLRRLGYANMNGRNFSIRFRRRNGSTGSKQIDVYASDSDSVFVVECKARKIRGRRSLQKDIQETISLQRSLRTSIYRQIVGTVKPKIIWLYVTENIIWSEPDVNRAQSGNIKIMTDNELQYFEAFAHHMGPAGRYQILGEYLKDQQIPGLTNVKIPAIKGKIGGEVFYSFVATPKHLLKISFVNHQFLNHPDASPGYQRMIQSSRIKKIGQFIKNGGFFPTNILLNFTRQLRFDVMSNKQNSDPNIKFGWITLPSKYRSAWIIDGQHRLYGFSRLPTHFLDQSLFVLAFENMPARREAELFITINHEQKSVPRSLLISLLADIRLGDDDPGTALMALSSAVVREMNDRVDSPFFGRFKPQGVPAGRGQNLTISEIVKSLRSSGLLGKTSPKHIKIDGPLSSNTDQGTIDRAVGVLLSYFNAVRNSNPNRWDNGQESFVSVNPGIRAHILVIAEAVSYLTHKKKLDFHLVGVEEFSKLLIDFCSPIFDFIESADDEMIKTKFSRRFGEGGVKEYRNYLMLILSEHNQDFGSEEFQRWQEQTTSAIIDEANQFLMKLAERLTDYIIDTLKSIHGSHRLPSDQPAYWELGVEDERIRRKAYEKQQKEKGRRLRIEAYLDIVDFEDIVKQKSNWDHFEFVFKNPQPNERKGQKYYLNWIHRFNSLRNIAAHKNQLKTYTDEDLDFIEWLRVEVSPKIPNGD